MLALTWLLFVNAIAALESRQRKLTAYIFETVPPGDHEGGISPYDDDSNQLSSSLLPNIVKGSGGSKPFKPKIDHGGLLIGPSNTENAYMAELHYWTDKEGYDELWAAVTEYKVDPDDPPRGPSRFHSRIELDMGTTSLSNRQILNPLDGKGVLRDVWTDPNGIFKGIYKLNVSDCMYFVQALLDPKTGRIPASADKYARFDTYFKRYIEEFNQNIPAQETMAQEDVGMAYNYHVVHTPQKWDRIVQFPVDSSELGRILKPVIFQEGRKEGQTIGNRLAMNGSRITEIT